MNFFKRPNLLIQCLMYLMAVYSCDVGGCNREFQTSDGRNKHVRIYHLKKKTKKVPCKHGCGRQYAQRCDSLAYHERTCDLNPHAARMGQGIDQQFYQTWGHAAASQNMELVRTAHGRSFHVYRKSINSSKITRSTIRF